MRFIDDIRADDLAAQIIAESRLLRNAKGVVLHAAAQIGVNEQGFAFLLREGDAEIGRGE